jgi:hypothetical protein
MKGSHFESLADIEGRVTMSSKIFIRKIAYRNISRCDRYVKMRVLNSKQSTSKVTTLSDSLSSYYTFAIRQVLKMVDYACVEKTLI